MEHYSYFNPNPNGRNVGDCAVRAIAKATGQDWEGAYAALALEGFLMGDLPNANSVWGAYLGNHGFEKKILDRSCVDCYTVNDFCEDNPKGTFVLALSAHVVCVEDGVLYDSWPSGNEVVLYYWQKGR